MKKKEVLTMKHSDSYYEKRPDGTIRNCNIYYCESTHIWKANMSYYLNKERKHKTFCGKTEKILNERIEAFKEDLSLGLPTDSELRFSNFSMNWMQSREKYRLKPSSYDTKMRTLTTYVIPAIGHIPINKIKHRNIQCMVNDLVSTGLSYSTVKKAYEVVSCCHKYYRILCGQGFNPAEGIELPQKIKPDLARHNYFTYDERKRIEEEISRTYSNGAPIYRFAPIISLLMYTGLRIGEALALTWDDIDFKENLIDINKSVVYMPVNGKHETVIQNSLKTDSSMRVLPMSNKAKEALIKLKEMSYDNNLVITTVNNRTPTRASIGKSLTRICRNAGIIDKDETRGVHTLRHTFATMLFENGCSIVTPRLSRGFFICGQSPMLLASP